MPASTLANDVKSYSQIIANHGAGSPQAKQFRKQMANDDEFLGGSWYLHASYCRSAGRSSYVPRTHDSYIGFRVAVSR